MQFTPILRPLNQHAGHHQEALKVKGVAVELAVELGFRFALALAFTLALAFAFALALAFAFAVAFTFQVSLASQRELEKRRRRGPQAPPT